MNLSELMGDISTKQLIAAGFAAFFAILAVSILVYVIVGYAKKRKYETESLPSLAELGMEIEETVENEEEQVVESVFDFYDDEEDLEIADASSNIIMVGANKIAGIEERTKVKPKRASQSTSIFKRKDK